jgi:predicted transcriptional regulator
MRTKNEKVWKIIMQQEKLVKYLRELSKTIKEMPKSERDAEYKRRLMETNWQVLGEVPYPLDIEKVLKCPLPAECFIFKSAMAPFNLTF